MATDTPEYRRETGRVRRRVSLQPEHEHTVVGCVRVEHKRQGFLAKSVPYAAALQAVRIVEFRAVKLIAEPDDRRCKGIVVPPQLVLVVIELERRDPLRLHGIVRETPDEIHDTSVCRSGTDVMANQDLLCLFDNR